LTCMAVKEGLLNIDPGQLTISDQGWRIIKNWSWSADHIWSRLYWEWRWKFSCRKVKISEFFRFEERVSQARLDQQSFFISCTNINTRVDSRIWGVLGCFVYDGKVCQCL
jgi:hypothetical protein